MKKLNKYILTTLSLVLFFCAINFTSNNKKIEAAGNVVATQVNGVFYNAKIGNNSYYGAFDRYAVGGQLSYCVDVTTSVVNGAWYSDSGNSRYSAEQWERMIRISHFGYGGGYLADTPTLLYATQMMIWQTAHNSSNITIRTGNYNGTILGKVNYTKHCLNFSLLETQMCHYSTTKTINNVVSQQI